jgi:hypothetical protein
MKSFFVDNSSFPTVLLLVSSLLSLPRAVHSFAVVSSHSSRLQQYDSVVVSSVSLLPPLFYSLASENTDNTRVLERSLADENDEEHNDEEHAAADVVAAKRYTSMPAGVEPHIQVIESHVDLQEFLDAEDDRLCMIKFHAAW